MSGDKIISEFSMCEEPKRELGEFLTKNLKALNAGDPAAKRALVELIRGSDGKPGVFPKVVLDHVGRVLEGNSEYAIHFRNMPENSAVDFGNVTSTSKLEKDIFAHHIGVALFEMSGLQHKASAFTNIRVNPKHADFAKVKKSPHIGTHPHRDFPGNDMMSQAKPVSYAAFSAPINDERAPTDLFILEKVRASLPEDVRKRSKALVEHFQLQSFDEDAPPTIMTLQQILDHLQDPSKTSQTISVFDPRNFKSDLADPNGGHYAVANTPADTAMIMDAIAKHSDRVILEKGDILVFGEDRIFHQGHNGDEAKIAAIPETQRNTRFLLHNAAGPTGPGSVTRSY